MSGFFSVISEVGNRFYVEKFVYVVLTVLSQSYEFVPTTKHPERQAAIGWVPWCTSEIVDYLQTWIVMTSVWQKTCKEPQPGPGVCPDNGLCISSFPRQLGTSAVRVSILAQSTKTFPVSVSQLDCFPCRNHCPNFMFNYSVQRSVSETRTSLLCSHLF